MPITRSMSKQQQALLAGSSNGGDKQEQKFEPEVPAAEPKKHGSRPKRKVKVAGALENPKRIAIPKTSRRLQAKKTRGLVEVVDVLEVLEAEATDSKIDKKQRQEEKKSFLVGDQVSDMPVETVRESIKQEPGPGVGNNKGDLGRQLRKISKQGLQEIRDLDGSLSQAYRIKLNASKKEDNATHLNCIRLVAPNQGDEEVDPDATIPLQFENLAYDDHLDLDITGKVGDRSAEENQDEEETVILNRSQYDMTTYDEHQDEDFLEVLREQKTIPTWAGDEAELARELHKQNPEVMKALVKRCPGMVDPTFPKMPEPYVKLFNVEREKL